MGLTCGIVGLPNVGKSTIFNALSAAGADVANYPFCTIEPNLGVVLIPDPRLYKLAELFKPEKITPNVLEILDIAGLVKGASAGEGLGNKFLSHIRQVQAILQVVRCFEDDNVVHVSGEIDPLRDIETIETELILADLETIQKRIDKQEKLAKGNDPKAKEELEVLKKVKPWLDAGKLARTLAVTDKETTVLRDLFLLTSKPILYVCNVGEEDLLKDSDSFLKVQTYAKKTNADVLKICGKVESELSTLEAEEKKEFLKEMGISEPGLNQLIRKGFSLLNLKTFFTAGPTEVRAWSIPQGTKAPQAAGVIHSDFEKGFIRAEIYHYDDLIQKGSEANVKAAGLMRLEGKEYEVKDGDIVYFRFNV